MKFIYIPKFLSLEKSEDFENAKGCLHLRRDIKKQIRQKIISDGLLTYY
jgi:hypothetical protein